MMKETKKMEKRLAGIRSMISSKLPRPSDKENKTLKQMLQHISRPKGPIKSRGFFLNLRALFY